MDFLLEPSAMIAFECCPGCLHPGDEATLCRAVGRILFSPAHSWIWGSEDLNVETAGSDQRHALIGTLTINCCDDFVLASAAHQRQSHHGPARIEGFVIARGVLCARYSGR